MSIYEFPLQSGKFTEPQFRFLSSKANVRGFKAGRGAGKAHVCMFEILRCMLNDGGKSLDPLSVAVVAPSSEVRDGLSSQFSSLAITFGIRYTERSRHGAEFEFEFNERVYFYSAARPNRLRGKNFSLCFLAEADQMKEEIFDILAACLRENGKQGRMLITMHQNTPADHWASKIFSNNNPGCELFVPSVEKILLPKELAAP